MPEIDKWAAELVEQERKPSAVAQEAMEVRQAALSREAKAHQALAETFDKAAERNEAKRAQMTVQAGKLRRVADYLDAGGAETRPERARSGREREDNREAGASRSGDDVAVQERVAPEVEPQAMPQSRESEQVRKIREMEKRRRERGQDRDRGS